MRKKYFSRAYTNQGCEFSLEFPQVVDLLYKYVCFQRLTILGIPTVLILAMFNYTCYRVTCMRMCPKANIDLHKFKTIFFLLHVLKV